MRVLLVNDYAAPLGGAERQLLALRDALRAAGDDARLLATSAGGAATADYSCVGTTGRGRALLQTANPWAARAVRTALAELEPDVVHVSLFLTQLSPLILAPLRDVPTLYYAVWYRSICPVGTKLLPSGQPCTDTYGRACRRNGCLPRRDWAPLMGQLALARRRLGAFRTVVANSEYVRARLAAEGVPASAVVLPGVASRGVRPPLAGPPTVVAAGRLVHEKGFAVLIRAFARAREAVPEARLLLAGDGPERRELERLASELGLAGAVELPGRLEPGELEARADAAWVQAVPSLWPEPFGLVAAEAMMRGTAVVAAAAGGLAEIVRDGETGFLVRPGDVDALAAALVRLLGDRALAERLGAQARRHAEANLGEERSVREFRRLYERIATEAVAA